MKPCMEQSGQLSRRYCPRLLVLGRGKGDRAEMNLLCPEWSFHQSLPGPGNWALLGLASPPTLALLIWLPSKRSRLSGRAGEGPLWQSPPRQASGGRGRLHPLQREDSTPTRLACPGGPWGSQMSPLPLLPPCREYSSDSRKWLSSVPAPTP